jgi:hypothetical protein
MADRAASPVRALTNDHGSARSTGAFVSAVPRELARRLSGTVEVLLLWHPHVNRVELSVCDPATGAGFHIEVPPANALDAFYHPYAYAVGRENSDRVHRNQTTLLDG